MEFKISKSCLEINLTKTKSMGASFDTLGGIEPMKSGTEKNGRGI